MVVGPTGWGTCIRTVSHPSALALACWKHTIAAGATSYSIAIYNALTGSQTANLSGHISFIASMAFSSDGTLLVSGSYDKTIRLWDVQTGGVVKTLYAHTLRINSVSISADSTMIASGSRDQTIRIWNIEIGDCITVWSLETLVGTVRFSPKNSQILLSSSSDNVVQQWKTDGHQIGSPIVASHISFSPDGTEFVSCMGVTVAIRNTDSMMTGLQFNVAKNITCCCFSPNGSSIVVAAGGTIYLWDISSPNPCLIQTLIGHSNNITHLVFSSPTLLISASGDDTIKFWEIDPLLTSSGMSGPESSLPASLPIKAVSLQMKDSLAFSIDSEGMVKIWDILTGLCKDSIMTPAKDIHYGEMQVISGGLVISWWKDETIYFWNSQQGEVQEVDTGPAYRSLGGLRISGDGSRVFCVNRWKIQSWTIETQELVTKNPQKAPSRQLDPLRMDNSKILVQLGTSSTEVWDFGAPGSTCIQLSELSSDRPQLNLTDIRKQSPGSPVQVQDSVTGKVIFQLYGKHRDPSAIQWDGQYLVTGYASGEVLILDFGQVLAK